MEFDFYEEEESHLGDKYRLIFGDELEDQAEIEEEPFGTFRHFKLEYKEKVNNFLRDFLISNVEVVIAKNNGDIETVKNQIGNLVEVYYDARIEFDKYKNKLTY
jgi:hypothetical protein